MIVSKYGIVAAPQFLASQAGARILEQLSSMPSMRRSGERDGAGPGSAVAGDAAAAPGGSTEEETP